MNLQDLILLYKTWGEHRYDESITQISHGLQSAHHAHINSASPALTIAALLHDIGHLMELDRKSGDVNVELNDKHDETGAEILSQIFGPEVAEPVRLHVQAKRYLCTADDTYYALLSPASMRSLEFQGGLMTKDEVTHFETLPYFSDAVALRTWDDAAKESDVSYPDFDSYIPIIRSVTY
jgi:phosphonate degradation associated HDIG domain protein